MARARLMKTPAEFVLSRDDAIARAPRPDVTARPADDDPSKIGFAKR